MDSIDSVVGVAILLGLVLLMLWARGREDVIAMPSSGDPTTTVEALLHSGRKIEAIKLYREEHGVGLKEAKHAVEALARRSSQ